MPAKRLKGGGGWIAIQFSDLTSTGTDHGLAVGHIGAVLKGFHGDVAAYFTCATAAATSSTWTGLATFIPGALTVVGNITASGDYNGSIRHPFYLRRTTAGTAERWFHWDGDGDSTDSVFLSNSLYMPCDGALVRVTLQCLSSPGTLQVKGYINGSIAQTVSDTPGTSVAHYDFTTVSLSKGDYLAVGTNPSSDPTTIPATAVVEFDWSTL